MSDALDERRELLREAEALGIQCLQYLDERHIKDAIRRVQAGLPAFEGSPLPQRPAAPPARPAKPTQETLF